MTSGKCSSILRWNFSGIEYSVFDQWGNTVFCANSVPVIWDGRFRNKDVLRSLCVCIDFGIVRWGKESAGR